MIEQLIFVGFNSRVAAVDRDSGRMVWQWHSPKGTGYTSVLLDGDRLVVSVMGYTYCLNSETGEVLWFNDLPGMGTGVVSLASLRAGSASAETQQVADQTERQEAAHSNVTS